MRILKSTSVLFILALLWSCVGDTAKEEQSEERKLTSREIIQQQQEEKEKQAENGSDQEVAEVQEITIEATDQMRFNKETITVKAGQTVRLTLKHVGQMSVEQMGHNWVLLTKGTDLMEFGQKAATAKENGYIPQDEASKVIVHTDLLGGGQEDTIEFVAPEKGTYDFICSFPGHVALMKGKFIVE